MIAETTNGLLSLKAKARPERVAVSQETHALELLGLLKKPNLSKGVDREDKAKTSLTLHSAAATSSNKATGRATEGGKLVGTTTTLGVRLLIGVSHLLIAP